MSPLRKSITLGLLFLISSSSWAGLNLYTAEENAKAFPFHEAVRRGNIKKVKGLLKNSRNVEMINTRDLFHSTPLSLAVMEGNDAMAKLLLESGAVLDKYILYAAVRESHGDTARLLLQFGACINNLYNGQTIFRHAIERNIWIAQILFESGQAINDNDKTEALFKAIREDHFVFVLQLVRSGANVDALDSFGQSPLILATNDDNSVIGQILLDNGADVNAVDKYGQNALHHAAFLGRNHMVQMLLYYGADFNRASISGKTPRDEALSRGHDEIDQDIYAAKVRRSSALKQIITRAHPQYLPKLPPCIFKFLNLGELSK